MKILKVQKFVVLDKCNLSSHSPGEHGLKHISKTQEKMLIAYIALLIASMTALLYALIKRNQKWVQVLVVVIPFLYIAINSIIFNSDFLLYSPLLWELFH